MGGNSDAARRYVRQGIVRHVSAGAFSNHGLFDFTNNLQEKLAAARSSARDQD